MVLFYSRFFIDMLFSLHLIPKMAIFIKGRFLEEVMFIEYIQIKLYQ
jgi:hypothetical protein